MTSHAKLVILLVLLLPQTCLSLIEVGRGNDPVRDGGWPLGCLDVANLTGRVLWWTGPGLASTHRFLYRCDSVEEFEDALWAFASIRAPKLELVIHDGPEHNDWLRDEEQVQSQADTRIDWMFTVWNPKSWHRAYNDPRSFFTADSPGFRLPVPPPTLDVYVGGGPIVWEGIEVPEWLIVIDRRAESAPVKPVGGGLLRGDVYDMATGKPVGGAQVVLTRRGGEAGETIVGSGDDAGSFEIQKIPVGEYGITIAAEGYAPRTFGQYRNKGNAFHEVVAEMARECSINGVVTDLEGNPIPGAQVKLRNTLGIDGRGYPTGRRAPATTDEEGRFEIHNLPVGFTQIRCSAPSLHCTNSVLELYEAPGELIALTMGRTGTIRGRVVDENGELPPGKLHVSVRPVGRQMGKWGGTGACKDDGSFEFTGVPLGEYLISTDHGALAQGDTTKAQTVSLTAGGTVEMEVIWRRQ